jgi:hypothetical protein
MIPSIIRSIVWCFPTSRVLVIIKEIFHIVLGISCGDYICINSLVLNNWNQSTFFGHKKGNCFSIFQIFQEEKEGRDIPTIYVDLCAKFV